MRSIPKASPVRSAGRHRVLGHHPAGLRRDLSGIVTTGPQRRDSAGSDMARGMSQASYGLAVAIGFAAIVAVAWGIGRLIDEWLGIEPWAQVVGAIAGWVLGVFVVYYASKRSEG